MKYTISTHNGSAVARDHNIRNRNVTDKEPHIDPDRIYEIWTDERPQDAYRRLFGEAVQEYNDRQKRADRRIKDYYRTVCKDARKHPVYEMIVAVGNKDNAPPVGTGKIIMREFSDKWPERNPNLELIGSYYHEDEKGVPHLHINYVPVAHGYKRGPHIQTGLVKALGEQGFYKIGRETAQIRWERRERGALEEICKEQSIDVERPTEQARAHLDTDLYQKEKMYSSLTQKLDRIQQQIKERQEALDKLLQEYEEKLFTLRAFEKLQERFDKLVKFCGRIRLKNGRTVAEEFFHRERKEQRRKEDLER